MPFLWQDISESADSQEELFVGNLSDDAFAYIWSRKEKAFRDTVRIRSQGMGGYNTPHTYPVLMRLAQLKKTIPQKSNLERIDIDPGEWRGVRHQYSGGVQNNHLLVSREENTDRVTLGISNGANTHAHIVHLQKVHFQDAVFQILLELQDAIIEDNTQYGHWYDVLQSGE